MQSSTAAPSHLPTLPYMISYICICAHQLKQKRAYVHWRHSQANNQIARQPFLKDVTVAYLQLDTLTSGKAITAHALCSTKVLWGKRATGSSVWDPKTEQVYYATQRLDCIFAGE